MSWSCRGRESRSRLGVRVVVDSFGCPSCVAPSGLRESGRGFSADYRIDKVRESRIDAPSTVSPDSTSFFNSTRSIVGFH